MSRRLVVAAALAAALSPGCKKSPARQESPPAMAVVTADAGTDAAAWAQPDPDYEKNRAELLRRGDPNMMKPAPIIDDSKPPEHPADMIEVVSKDVMMVGAIKVDLKAGALELPARTAAPVGPLAYVIVGKGGKAYESLLLVEATGLELRLALKLLGYEGTTPAADGTLAAPTAADTVLARVRVAGKLELPLAEMLTDQATGKRPADIAWQVVGFTDANRPAALSTADLMTLVMRDTLAPLRATVDAGNPYTQNPGLIANAKRVPAAGTEVTLVLARRPDAPPAPPAPTSLQSPGTTP